MPDEVTDAAKKERREFHIPKFNTERSFYGTEFEAAAAKLESRLAQEKQCNRKVELNAALRTLREEVKDIVHT